MRETLFCRGRVAPASILLRSLILVIMLLSPTLCLAQKIEGKSELKASELTAYIQQRNPDFDPAIAEAYIKIGKKYGLRGDIALCQAIIETGWFRYQGSAVKPEHHNYCGLGVVKNGQTGAGFDTVEDGVRAHIQHLYAYCCNKDLPRKEKLVDPRFSLVKRGSAPKWKDLSGRWAQNPQYGKQILDLHARIKSSR